MIHDVGREDWFGAGKGTRSLSMDRLYMFGFFVVGDLIAFIVSFGILWFFKKERSRRFIRVQRERKRRTGRKFRCEHSLRKLILTCLYVQGTCEIQGGKWQGTSWNDSSGNMTTAGTEEFSLMAVGGDGTHQNDNVFAPPSESIMDNGDAVQQEEDLQAMETDDDVDTPSASSSSDAENENVDEENDLERDQADAERPQLSIEQVGEIIQDESPDWVHLYQYGQ